MSENSTLSLCGYSLTSQMTVVINRTVNEISTLIILILANTV